MNMLTDSCVHILPFTLVLWCVVNVPFLVTRYVHAADFLWTALEGMFEDVIALKRAGKLSFDDQL
jgi:hypothetical protein